MQARAHGLTVVASSSLYSAELVARAIKQEPGMGDCTSNLYPHLPSPDMSRPTTLNLNNGTISYNDSPTEDGEPGVYDSPNKSSTKLEDMLMDNTLSPVGSSDPLLSSGSPVPSNSSGSSSMDEHDNGCQQCQLNFMNQSQTIRYVCVCVSCKYQHYIQIMKSTIT